MLFVLRHVIDAVAIAPFFASSLVARILERAVVGWRWEGAVVLGNLWRR
jgi:hypothetical protein